MLKSPWFVTGVSALGVGILLFLIFIGSYILNDHTFIDSANIFITLGFVWIIIGVPFFLYAQLRFAKLRRLKKTGDCYNGKVLQMVSLNARIVEIGTYITAYISCSYENKDGEICYVKSGYLLLPHYFSNKDDSLTATVYVNQNNPKDYFVEIGALD